MARTDEIIAFTTIVDLGTFSAAADHLNITTAGVSRRIKSLEERLGVSLLKRTTRTASLTEAGELYNQRIREVVDSMMQLEDEVQNLTGTPAGKIKVNAPPAFSEKVLGDILHQFSTQYPKIKLEIVTTLDKVDMRTEMFDVAFRLSKSNNPSDINNLIRLVRFSIVGSPDYFARYGEPKTIGDMHEHNCLLFTDQSRRGSWVVRDNHKVKRVNVSGNLVTNSANVLINAALNGQGLVYIPDFLYEEYVQKGVLKEVLSQHANEVDLYAIYTEGMLSSTKVNLLIDFVKHNI